MGNNFINYFVVAGISIVIAVGILTVIKIDNLRNTFLCLFGCFLALSVILSIRIYSNNHLGKEDNSLAINAVNYLYNFETIEELDSNMSKLEEITSNSVYIQLTIDNEDRLLSTYLKFKNEPTKVVIKDSNENYIKYSLINSSIAEDRIFMFTYTESEGKLMIVNEYELIPFLGE